jgi:extracellular factor (EF) 3-hydroxypalmitic acid methyl ester biosynthesis protein
MKDLCEDRIDQDQPQLRPQAETLASANPATFLEGPHLDSAPGESVPWGILHPSMHAAIETFKDTMLSTDRAVKLGKTDAAELQRQVDRACELVKATLHWHAQAEPALEEPLGKQLFRETFPFFLTSRFIDRSYMKPRGYAGDYETINIIYDSDVQGLGRLGPLLDRWALGLGACRAVRNRRHAIAGQVDRLLAGWPGAEPMPVCSVASGPAREVFDLLDRDNPARIHVTCLDVDPDALRFSAGVARQKALEPHLSFALENILRLAAGRGKTNIKPQQFIYSMGLMDYLADRLVIRILDWMYDHLLPGGVAAIGNFAKNSPDKEFMQHIGEWTLIHRSPEDLRAFFAASKFAQNQVEVDRDETGIQLLAFCRK